MISSESIRTAGLRSEQRVIWIFSSIDFGDRCRWARMACDAFKFAKSSRWKETHKSWEEALTLGPLSDSWWKTFFFLFFLLGVLFIYSKTGNCHHCFFPLASSFSLSLAFWSFPFSRSLSLFLYHWSNSHNHSALMLLVLACIALARRQI